MLEILRMDLIKKGICEVKRQTSKTLVEGIYSPLTLTMLAQFKGNFI
jgi:hypothetical protein